MTSMPKSASDCENRVAQVTPIPLLIRGHCPLTLAMINERLAATNIASVR